MSTSASSASAAALERRDVRTIVGGGVKLGVATVVGVVVFVLLSRALSGRVEVVVQSIVVLAGGALASYLPAYWVRPCTIDAIGWSTLLGFLGAVVFTFIDTAVLRPVQLYPWTWDAIGGGSGWWYIPIWWMGSAFLAWLGAWVYSARAQGAAVVNVPGLAAQTVGLALVLFVLLKVTGIARVHPAVAALSYSLGLVIHVPIATTLSRR